jgi:tetratricopeptide (TPR) repeat protein
LARKLSRFELARVENGVGMFVSSGNLLSWTGMSFYLSKKVLRLLDRTIDHDDPRSSISYRAAEVTHAFLAGEWNPEPYDAALVEKALGLGETFLTSNYVIFHGRMALEQARLSEARSLAEKLNEIGVEYDHSYPPALHVYLHAKILLKERHLGKAIAECDEGRRVAEAAALDTVLYGLRSLKARALAYAGEIDQAEELLQKIEQSSHGIQLPKSYRGDYFISRCTVDVMRQEAALRRGNAADNRHLHRRSIRSAHRLMMNSAKVASHRVEAQRLAGLSKWLAGRWQKAVRHWERGVEIGESLGAGLDLARLYFEIGKRFHESPGKSGRQLSRPGGDYLDRAQAMFEDACLEWDIAELDDISGR